VGSNGCPARQRRSTLPLEEAVAELKTVPERWYDVAKAFFG
jgi:hypothetical protein